MKKVFYKIASIVLSFIVIFSTLSFGIATHFCGNEPVAVSYFGDANSCSTDQADSCCDDDKRLNTTLHDTLTCADDHISETPCCTNEKSSVDGANFINDITTNKLAKLQLAVLPVTNMLITNYKTTKFYNLHTYKPPILKYNFQVSFQSFLI